MHETILHGCSLNDGDGLRSTRGLREMCFLVTAKSTCLLCCVAAKPTLQLRTPVRIEVNPLVTRTLASRRQVETTQSTQCRRNNSDRCVAVVTVVAVSIGHGNRPGDSSLERVRVVTGAVIGVFTVENTSCSRDVQCSTKVKLSSKGKRGKGTTPLHTLSSATCPANNPTPRWLPSTPRQEGEEKKE
jgi:hypothetical protein